MKTLIAILLTAALAFAGGHAATVSTMEIETDGDCDSAFVTTLGREYFMGANGYEIDQSIRPNKAAPECAPGRLFYYTRTTHFSVL